MSVAIIMIALMSFALTSVTAYSYQTAENTNRTVQGHESTNEAKRLISEAMVKLRDGIDKDGPEDDLPGIEGLVDEYGTDIIKKERQEDFDDEIKPLINEIEDTLGVHIREADEKINSDNIRMDLGAKAFRFAYPVANDREMVRYLFFSDYGTHWEAYDAFEYSIGSSANVVLNGGEYTNSADVYGQHIFSGMAKVFKDPLDTNYQVESGDSTNYPVGGDLRFVSPNYNECESSGDDCIVKDSSDNLLIDEERYGDAEELYGDAEEEGNYFSDLFAGFDYDEFYYETLAHNLGTDKELDESNYNKTELEEARDDETVEKDGVTYNALGNEDSAPFTLNQSHSPISEHTIIFQDTLIDMNNDELELEGNTLIIFGDLTLDNVKRIRAGTRAAENESEEDYKGQVFVFGDIDFENENQEVRSNVNFFSTGDIDVSFARGDGFKNYGQGENEGMGLFAGGNIAINHSFTPPHNSDKFHMALLMFAQGSIKIDAALEDFHISGAIYAQGKGNGFDDINIKRRDGTTESFKGIIINSNNQSGSYPDENNDQPGNGRGRGNNGGVNPGNGKPGGPNGNPNNDADSTFIFKSLANTGPNETKSEQLRESFSAVPDFKQLIIEPKDGEVITDKSTFRYEPSENSESE